MNKGSSKSWAVCITLKIFVLSTKDLTTLTDLNLEIKLPFIPTDCAELLSLAWFVASLKSLEVRTKWKLL